ncbi:MAG: glycosyltransferase [PVC group bacterium]
MLSVIIAVKNEGKNIDILLRGIRETLEGAGIPSEIIVVDGCSGDDTVERARSAADRVFIQQNPGYGNAFQEGLKAAQGDYVLTLDGDFSHPPRFISELYRQRQEAELIIASRWIEGGTAEMPWWRMVLSRILNTIFSRVLFLPIRDISSGFRLYRADILSDLDLKAHDFSILEEIAIKIWNRGYRIKEVPFSYRPRHEGCSKAKLFNLGKSYLKTAFAMWKLRNSCEVADYDDRAHNSIIPIQRYWQRTRYRIVKDFISGTDRILDIGCGSSNIIKSLPRAVGLDISKVKLRYLRKFHPLLVNASIFSLPFGDRTFRGIICSEVIEHVPFRREMFRELNRVLGAGGVLVLGTPDYSRRSWRMIEFAYGILMPNAYKDEHITHYTHSRLNDLLREYGFIPENHAYIAGSELIIKARKTGSPRVTDEDN